MDARRCRPRPLKGRVVDAVMLLQFLAGAVQHIVVKRGTRAHEMRRQRGSVVLMPQIRRS